MKQFFWKIMLCLVPCLLAGWVTTDAMLKYQAGEPGGFKLGVDLVGGTILVYEIDLRKQQEEDKDSKFDPVRDINVLAESLKRRIDPNDLYNIVIRPAGGEGRVEIILPTGGTHRTKKAEEAWNALLAAMEEHFHLTEKLEIGRGKNLALADKIQQIKSKGIWDTKLFNDDASWQRLKDSAYTKWPDLLPDAPKQKVNEKIEALNKAPEGRLQKFAGALFTELKDTESAQTEAGIEAWIKQRAWDEMLEHARQKWPFLKEFKADMERVPPDGTEQLVSFIQAKGVVIGQSALAVLEPLLGKDSYKAVDKDGNPIEGLNAKEITAFVDENYGPSVYSITQEINKKAEEGGRSRDLNVEEVQRIKDLVAKVGSLEFRILANSNDDAEGQADAMKMLGPDLSEELEKRAKQGLPPPGPRNKEFWVVKLRGGQTSKLTYSWVELGPQERKALNLDNNAKIDAERSYLWLEAERSRNKATYLTDRAGRKMLQGALFFSRECKDQNLPEEERRKKQYEYFVLTRDPEFDPTDPQGKRRVPKIDGSYLVSAQSGPSQTLGPAVHFVFNSAGGELFGDITRKNVPSGGGAEENQIRRHLAIILDGLVMSAPTINSEIRTQGQISGSFTNKEVDALVNILRAGRLPATLKPQPVSENTMGPTLGEDTINAGLKAIGLAFGGVLIFMIVYYRFAGLVASVALLANLVLTVGFMVAVQATFTLPGLAGIVLMLGMAVDANVLIYERLREERERGCSLVQALRNGYERALPTIIDTHLSSIFTAIVLYIVGNDQLKGFGVSLTVGLIISLFTSLFMTRLLFDIWQHQGWLKKLSMLRLFARPDIDFMAIRKIMFVTTIVLSVIGFVLFVGRLPDDLNIDFRGGTAYGGQMTKAMDLAELRKMLDEAEQAKKLKVKVEPADTELRYTLTYEGATPRTVSLANKPAGATTEEHVKAIAERASHLPDVSVELYYPSFEEAEENKSRYFNVRTSEKEPDIVQAVLDRLLRDEGRPLMKKVYMKAKQTTAKAFELQFYSDENNKEPDAGSLSFVKSLFQRELLRSYVKKDKNELPFQYDITGEGKTTADGKNSVMTLKFESELAKSDLDKIKKVLSTTELEFAARPQPDRLENFDSQLATETRLRAMWAILASWGAILMYLWFRFGNWTFGLAAVLCLIHDLFFTLGAIAACHFIHGTFLGAILGVEDFKLDLNAVAALLTLVGYSVNDTIVVFDRIREVRGKNPDLTPQMINDSINQTLSRTVLASLTTWIVVFILYVFGGPGVKLFAFVMVVGVIVGTYSSIYIASPLLLIFGEGVHEDAATRLRQPEPEGAGV
jgi:SecD/SecF fusion protein